MTVIQIGFGNGRWNWVVLLLISLVSRVPWRIGVVSVLLRTRVRFTWRRWFLFSPTMKGQLIGVITRRIGVLLASLLRWTRKPNRRKLMVILGILVIFLLTNWVTRKRLLFVLKLRRVIWWRWRILMMSVISIRLVKFRVR